MNTVYTGNIGNARDITLLGGRLQLENGCLTLGENDLLLSGTSYDYFPSPSSRDEFFVTLRQRYVKAGEVHVFNGATIDYKLKYVPVLKCGDKILTLNSEDDYFITDNFFESPHRWRERWDNMIVPVSQGCLQHADASLLPIKLSYKEIEYLVPRLGLSLPKQLQVVLLPFHIATVTSKQHEYHVAQIALQDEASVADYPLFEDSTFTSMTHVVSLLAIYGACVAFVLDHTSQILPFIQSYAGWCYEHLQFHNLTEIFGSYVPVLYLGNLFGWMLEVVQFIILFIVMGCIVPAIALVVPSVVSTLLAYCTVWIRRVYLSIRKHMHFDYALKASALG